MNFIDEDYEGINLKIPFWFYSINKESLKPILDSLQEFLETKALSGFHPDNQRNIIELDNIESKKELVENRRKEEKYLSDKREKYNQDLMDGNIYETEWKKKTDVCDVDYPFVLITKDNKKFEFTGPECVTKKYNTSSLVLNKFLELKENLNIELTTSASGFHFINGIVNYYLNDNKIIHDNCIRLENLSSDIWKRNLTFSLKTIRFYFYNSKNKICYTLEEIYYDKNKKCYCFKRNTGNWIYLENYDLKNEKFIKNHDNK